MMYSISKRLIDIVGSVFCLIIFSPVIIVAAVYIKIISPDGPIFSDTPKRAAKGGREFKMYKFRTMIPNAHEYMLSHPELYEKYKNNNYKLDDDPRWLPGAKFIRKYSIDEFPQFINVLFGDMSLVGPRAYYPFELRDQEKVYPETAAHIKEVLSVKPGITGLWKVSGRSAVSFPDRIKIDSYYANKHSVLLDLTILLKTPAALLSGRGAC